MTFEAWVYRTGGSGNQTIIGNDDGGWDRALLVDATGGGAVHVGQARYINNIYLQPQYTGSIMQLHGRPTKSFALKMGHRYSERPDRVQAQSSLNGSIGAMIASWLFPFRGTIDEARIWNTTRSQCQIQQFMTCEITSTAKWPGCQLPFQSGCSGGYKFVGSIQSCNRRFRKQHRNAYQFCTNRHHLQLG